MNKFEPKQVGAYLLRGTFIIAPLFFTLMAIWKILNLLDSPVQEIFYSIFGYHIYGLGLLTVLFILIVTGYFGTTVIMGGIFRSFEKLIFRIPLVKEIYKALRDIIGAFVSDKKKFEKPVLVEVYDGVFRIGFITNEDLSIFHLDPQLIAVYFPLSYAFTGELLLIHREKLKLIDSKDVKGLMKFTISGGIVNGEDFEKE